MFKRILIISGSPKKTGNTSILIEWFLRGAKANGAETEVIDASGLKYASNGCTSCRGCQKRKEYGCLLKDEASPVLEKMTRADVIVIATPLYFFSASAQIKNLTDRMFSLYKWDNSAGTMESALTGKTLLLIASAYEDAGLDALAAPFAMTAEYTGMCFDSLLVENAGISGDVAGMNDIMEKALAFGNKAAARD